MKRLAQLPLPAIKWRRLFLAIAITFVVADTYPHPNLSPGVLQSAIATVTRTNQTTLDDLTAGAEADKTAEEADVAQAE
jgi:hypothetical protein